MTDPFDFNRDGKRDLSEDFLEYQMFKEVMGDDENTDDENTDDDNTAADSFSVPSHSVPPRYTPPPKEASTEDAIVGAFFIAVILIFLIALMTSH